MPAGTASLPKTALLRKPAQYRTVYQQGRRLRGRHFSLIYIPNDEPFHRLGISVHGAKNAVTRNRTKRLIREFFRLNRQFLPGHLDIVFASRKDFQPASLAEIKDQIEQVATAVK